MFRFGHIKLTFFFYALSFGGIVLPRDPIHDYTWQQGKRNGRISAEAAADTHAYNHHLSMTTKPPFSEPVVLLSLLCELPPPPPQVF